MELHVAALFRYDNAGRMICTNEEDGTPAPRLFLGRTRGGNLWRFGQDVPDGLAQALDHALMTEPVVDDLRQPPSTLNALCDLLAGDAPVNEIEQGPAWQIPAETVSPADSPPVVRADPEMLRPNFPYLANELADCQPCVAIVHDGMAVSVCFSSRLTATAAEAGLHTIEAFRGRGLAAAVVAAWATAVREQGRVPLYSTSWQNRASRRVASKLRLRLYGADLSLT